MTKRTKVATGSLWVDCAKRGCKRQCKAAPNHEYRPGRFFHKACAPKALSAEERKAVESRPPLPAGWAQVRHGATAEKAAESRAAVRQARKDAKAS